MKVKITKELLDKLVKYDPDTGKIYWLPRDKSFFKRKMLNVDAWNRKYSGKEAFNIVNGNYFCGTILGVRLRAHQVAYIVSYGYLPNVIDHINGNGYDNRLCNLRESTTSENAKNQKKSLRNTSGVVGVSYRKDRDTWYSYIGIEGKTKALGTYKCITAAIVVRKVAEFKLGFSENHGRDS